MIVFFIFEALSCARPKYADTLSSGPEQLSEKPSCDAQFIQSGYCLNWAWIKKPTSTEAGSLFFKVYKKDNSEFLLTDFTTIPYLELWMPSMGHGSSPTQTSRTDLGTYLTEKVFFVMPGQWEIKFQIKENNQIADEAVVSITI